MSQVRDMGHPWSCELKHRKNNCRSPSTTVRRSEEHTSELQSLRHLRSSRARRSSDLSLVAFHVSSARHGAPMVVRIEAPQKQLQVSFDYGQGRLSTLLRVAEDNSVRCWPRRPSLHFMNREG